MLSGAVQADADVESGGTYSESAMSLVDKHLKANRDENWEFKLASPLLMWHCLTSVDVTCKFPPSSTQLCHFGATFQVSSHPVVEFQAAIGTTAYSQDVVMFHKISRPCLPCRSCLQLGSTLIRHHLSFSTPNCQRVLETERERGVTIKTELPNVDNMTTSMDDMEPFDDTRTDVPAVKMSRQDGVGVIWDKPPKDENIDSVSQTSDKMLTGGFLSADDFTAQYLSGASDTFKSFIVAPESTRDKTDRYLRNRIQRWDGTTVSTLPDQTVNKPLSITMPFDKTQLEDFMQDIHAWILHWCADK
ncbi:hypothetical protein LSAT2_032763 [Lamellibrachia satsuma]|nr:hypothetical protein LSAT2_032763 [Lamellibrachia satsuma]